MVSCYNKLIKIYLEEVDMETIIYIYEHTINEDAQKLIEAGFEYVCEFNDVKIFKKRK